MNKFYALILALSLTALRVVGQNISGVINDYREVSAVGVNSVVVTPDATPFSCGDRVIVIQMQGATVDLSTGTTFGDITNYNSAGKYEFAVVSSVTGSQINFTANLLNGYNPSGAVQVVRVPVYENPTVVTGNKVSSVRLTSCGCRYTTAPTVTFTGGGGSGAAATARINSRGQVIAIDVTNPGTGYTSAPTVNIAAPSPAPTDFSPTYCRARAVAVVRELTAKQWDGKIGGVLALETPGTLTLNENIDVTGMGFRGGTPGNTTSSTTASRYAAWGPIILNGEKAEAIALNPDAYARGFGKFANGGGGARQREGGGAGGGNGGAGGNGGWQNNAFGTGNTPAEGGVALVYSNVENRIFLGGGGGGGAAENGTLASHVSVPGGYGGGIVIIRANAIVTSGSKSIVSNGTFNHIGFLTGPMIEQPSGTGDPYFGDGGSGGGAGGTLVLQVPSAGFPASLTLSANGARGGNTTRNNVANRYGPGGGGGGGAIWTPGGTGSATATVAGGTGGYNLNNTSWNQHGAGNGANGVTPTGLSMPGPGLSCSHVANAGPDQPSVPSLSTTLAATPPVCGESGSWSLVSGPGTVTFTPVTAYNATATVSTSGTYTFRWKLVKDGCPVTDDVDVTYSASCSASPANAGTDKYYCSGSVAMTGNTPPPGESGAWSMVSGPGTATFVNPASPTTNVSFTPNGNYVLRWTISKPGCSSTQDDVNINHIGPPTILAPTSIVCDGFTANWTAVPGATNYRIDVALDAAFTIPVYTNLNAGGGTSFAVTGLVGGTKYYYRMRVGAPCTSTNSSVADVTTTMPTTVYWIGGASNNWFTNLNWSCKVVPTPTINAVINNATPPSFWPTISGGTADCKDLTITSSVASTATRLLVTGTSTVLNVHGNMLVNANTTLPGFTMVVENGAKLYNNIHPTSSARFGPEVAFPSTYYNKKQLRVTNPSSEAQFRQLNITAGVPCSPVAAYPYVSVASFKPWGNACAHPGVYIDSGGAMDVAGNLTIGWAGSAFEGILWLDNADANISGNVNIHNQFTGAASRGIGLNNGATLSVVGLLSTLTDGASLILENSSYAWIGAMYTNTTMGLPCGASVVNSTLYVDGDAHLRQNGGIGVLATDASDLVVAGDLIIDTPFPVAAMTENLIAKSDGMFPAAIWVDGIFKMADGRRALLWENSTMTVSGFDMSGRSIQIHTNASCTLRTTASLYSGGHLDLGGTSPVDTCSRIVMDGNFYSEPTLIATGNLNLLPNSHLDASNPTVRPVIQLTGNWNRSLNNVVTGPNKRGFARGKSMVSFIGGAAQSINTPAADPIERFHGLEINCYNGVTLNATAKAEVYDLLLLTDGIFNTGAAGNYVWVRKNTPGSVNRVLGHVNGWLYRDVTADPSYFEFPVGKGGAAPASTHFRRMSMKFNTVSGFDRVDVKFNNTPSTNAGTCPNIDGLDIDGTLTGAGGYWTVNPNSGSYTTNYDMRLYLNGMGTFSDNQFLVVSRNNGETNCNDWKGGGTINPNNGLGRMVADGFALRMNLPFFSEKALGVGSIPPLAVELLDFNAEPQNDRVLLTWNTLKETNNAYFAIERSAGGPEFSEIGRVKGAGTTSEPQSYRTFDLAPLPGTSYYRLKQTDFDGKFAYSQTVSVTFEQTGDQVLLYPNPTTEGMNTRIRFTSSRERQCTFQLFDLTGRKVWEETRDDRNGDIEIPTNALTAGVYLFKTNLSPATQKLVVN